MRAVFGVLGLLIVLAVVATVARKQLLTPVIPANHGTGLLPTPDAGVTPPQQSREIQQQVKQSVEAAMQQARPMPDDK